MNYTTDELVLLIWNAATWYRYYAYQDVRDYSENIYQRKPNVGSLWAGT